LFPIETIVIAGPNSTKFVHDEGSPSPSSPGLDAIPKLMFHRFTSVRHTKNTLLGYRSRCNSRPPLINRHRLMPNRPNEGGLFAISKRVPHLRPPEPIVAREVPLPLIRRSRGARVPIDDGIAAGLGSIDHYIR
jgi:hypothetical protein